MSHAYYILFDPNFIKHTDVYIKGWKWNGCTCY